MAALNTDLYELTMAAGYFAEGKTDEIATFEVTARRLPETRNFLVAAGLQQAVEYLLHLRFQEDEIAYLKTLAHFRNAPAEFFDFLRDLRFTGDLYAMPEGTPVFPNEPIAIVRAPIIQAQLLETFLLSTFAFQTMIAAKAARCVAAAQGRPVVEFGSRRAHSPEAGILAGRAAYLAGCSGTSNTQAGKDFGLPVFGTAAHSWTMSFATEEQSFRSLQELLGENTVFLLDTYDTLEGARLATRIGKPLWGVRLDSGNLVQLSQAVRSILDDSGLHDAKIFATNDLDEYRIAELLEAGAPLDAFGVGTQLATSADAPTISAVYKLVELRRGEKVHYAAKFSDEKSTLPGAKQVYRMPDHDVVALATECDDRYAGEPLIRPVIVNGRVLEALPTAAEIQKYARGAITRLPDALHSIRHPAEYPVRFSQAIQDVAGDLRRRHDPSHA